MDDAVHIVFIWLHILGVALFVGAQFFLAVAWVPASRGIVDLPTRVSAMRTITQRFAYLAGVGLLLILVAGIYLVGTWRDYYLDGQGAGFFAYRFGVLFTIKMSLLAVMLTLLGLHMFVVGPRLLTRLEAEANGRAVDGRALSRVQRQSMALSLSGLLLALVIMALGAGLATFSFSLREI